MQCGYRETLVPNRDLATKQGHGNILFHDQLTDTEHDLCTSDAHYFRIGSFRRRHVKLNRSTRACFCCRLKVGSPISGFPLCVFIVNLKNTTPPGDIPREHYRQHCQYRLRGLRYIARGLASSIIKGNIRRHLVISHASIIDNIANTGYGALRYIARGLASSIIKRNMHISNRWRHILNARNYRRKYI